MTQHRRISGYWAANHPNWVLVAAICGVASVLTACANTPGSPSSTLQVDNLASRCVVSVLASSLFGGVIGAATEGKGGAVAGVAIGAASGGALCAVMATLDAQDRARIRAAEAEVASTGRPQVLSYNGEDGLVRHIAVRPSNPSSVSRPTDTQLSESPSSSVPSTKEMSAQTAAANGQKICRPVDTDVSIESKGQASLPTQLICREPNGDWEPALSRAT